MEELVCKTRDGGKIKILYYRSENKNAPLLVEIHGGGFTEFSAYTDKEMCADMSNKFGVNVASIDYRLAPAVVYPTATYDCADAFNFLVGNGSLDFDRDKTAVLGESAGANLAVDLCGLCRGRIRGQVLLYPYLNVKEDNRKHVLVSFSRRALKKLPNAYFPNIERRGEFTASPNLGKAENFKSLSSALVITAGIDTLRPDGIIFAEKLKQNGIQCTHIDYPKAYHGYFENVPNGGMEKWWWVSKSKKEKQRECYRLTLDEIQKFLKEIYK